MLTGIRQFNATKIGVISGCLLLFGIIFCAILIPKFFKHMVKGQLTLKPTSDVRPMYVKVPFAIDFRIYVFNLTNREEVHKGGKPKLQQIGPYYFEEWKEKYDLVDDDEEDTLTYHYKNTFLYKPEKNGPGLTGDEIITMVHPLIATMLLAVNVDKKPMIGLADKAIKDLFHNPTDMFWTGRVMDVLFDGIPIDCSSENFEATATCSVFKTGEVPAIREHNDTHFAFSLFAAANGTDIGEMKVYRGAKVSRNIGKVISFNEETEMDVWDEDECNQYVGTDQTIFPPYMDLNDGIWAYEPSICRSLGIEYTGKASKYKGIPVKVFELDLASEANTKECFCRDPPDECPPKGTFDLFKCVGAPLFGSLPHFYKCDPSLLEKIGSGLNPNKEDHGITLLFEPVSGTPVSAAKRLQFNLEVVPIEETEIMKDVQEMMYPLFWVEEAAHLNDTFAKMIRNSLILALRIQKYLKYTCIMLGLIGCIFSGAIFIMKQEGDSSPIKVNKVSANSG